MLITLRSNFHLGNIDGGGALIVDGNNLSWTSGPASVSDGVTTLEKGTETWFGAESCWPSEELLEVR